jgi:hypothetical protein
VSKPVRIRKKCSKNVKEFGIPVPVFESLSDIQNNIDWRKKNILTGRFLQKKPQQIIRVLSEETLHETETRLKYLL